MIDLALAALTGALLAAPVAFVWGALLGRASAVRDRHDQAAPPAP